MQTIGLNHLSDGKYLMIAELLTLRDVMRFSGINHKFKEFIIPKLLSLIEMRRVRIEIDSSFKKLEIDKDNVNPKQIIFRDNLELGLIKSDFWNRIVASIIHIEIKSTRRTDSDKLSSLFDSIALNCDNLKTSHFIGTANPLKSIEIPLKGVESIIFETGNYFILIDANKIFPKLKKLTIRWFEIKNLSWLDNVTGLEELDIGRVYDQHIGYLNDHGVPEFQHLHAATAGGMYNGIPEDEFQKIVSRNEKLESVGIDMGNYAERRSLFEWIIENVPKLIKFKMTNYREVEANVHNDIVSDKLTSLELYSEYSSLIKERNRRALPSRIIFKRLEKLETSNAFYFNDGPSPTGQWLAFLQNPHSAIQYLTVNQDLTASNLKEIENKAHNLKMSIRFTYRGRCITDKAMTPHELLANCGQDVKVNDIVGFGDTTKLDHIVLISPWAADTEIIRSLTIALTKKGYATTIKDFGNEKQIHLKRGTTFST